ncbi:NHL repeat-containing protein [Streptomyces sp. MA5143a]|uniref:NHL repeat-containing protein n=1 Tax=Streptomyces sp. MA5143a TaxID=2083010 RepID=UPI000D289595|nr:NHL repeat-containing protein [Streptomyces sp. MA5143a]SPF06464.1 Serine/threonine-protein kinase PknD [Streptomyces sp. MA5143a]
MSESLDVEDPPESVKVPHIATLAGNGNSEYSGDGQIATAAGIQPNSTAVDTSGNFYIADTENHRVRKVDAKSRKITTVAGNGDQDYSGDDGPAVDAALNYPRGVTVDPAGNLYIADTENNRVRRVDATTGTIRTVAGDGTAGSGGDEAAAIAAQLYTPFGVALDAAGNLYIADTDNARVRRVDAASGVITTVAGNGATEYSGDDGPAIEAALNGPRSVMVDSGGNLYIADTDNHRVRRVSAATGTITTIAGNGTAAFSGDDGPAADAALNGPRSVMLDSGGNLYIADTDNHRVRRVSAATGTITTIAGNGTAAFSGDDGPAADAALNGPRGVTLDASRGLLVTDTDNHRVRVVTGLCAPGAPFLVYSGGRTRVVRGTGALAWPGVYVKSLGEGNVAPQTVRVTLPPGKGLQFHGSGNLIVLGEDENGAFRQLASYDGTLSDDKQTFTTHGPVDLHLHKAGASNSLLIGVVAPADAVPGETELTFTVGDHPPTAAPVEITATFSVSPGGRTRVQRGTGAFAWPGVYVKSLGEGNVAPQTVRVTLPPGKGLQFHGSGNLIVYGEDENGVSRQLASYGGTLSDDKQTFTTHGPVDLHLHKAGASNSLLIGVVAPADAVPGETELTFTVADHPPTAAPVDVE